MLGGGSLLRSDRRHVEVRDGPTAWRGHVARP